MSLPLAALLLAALGAGPLTEDAAVQQARQANPALQALEKRVAEEKAQADAEVRLKNPTLRVQNLRSDRLLSPGIEGRSYGNHPFEDTELALRWSPPKLGEWAFARAAAGVEVARAEAELEQGRRDFAARVRSLHATVLGLDSQIALVQDAEQERTRLRERVQRLRDEHAVTRLDLELVSLELLDASTDLRELRARRRLAHDELLSLLGAGGGEALTLSAGGAPECAEPEALPALLERSRQNSLAARRLEARRAEIDAQRAQTNLALVPWFDYVQLGYVAGGDSNPDFAELSFALTLPLLEWGCASRKMLDARASRVAEQDQADAAELERQVRLARQEVLEQSALVACYRQAEPAMAQGVETLAQASEARELELTMLTRVESRILGARRNHAKARMACRLAQIELERLVGPAGARP